MSFARLDLTAKSVKIQRWGFIKNISLDKYLTQIFRETVEKSGWNIYRKGRQWSLQ